MEMSRNLQSCVISLRMQNYLQLVWAPRHDGNGLDLRWQCRRGLQAGAFRNSFSSSYPPWVTPVSSKHKIRMIFSSDFPLCSTRDGRSQYLNNRTLWLCRAPTSPAPQFKAFPPTATGQLGMSSHVLGPALQGVHLILGPVHATCSHFSPSLSLLWSVTNCHRGQLEEAPSRTLTQRFSDPSAG